MVIFENMIYLTTDKEMREMPTLIINSTTTGLITILTLIILFFAQSGFATDLQQAQYFFKNSQYDSAYTSSKRSFEAHQGYGDSIEFRSALIAGISAAQQKIVDSTDYIGIAHQLAVDSKNPRRIAEADFAREKSYF
ncbi:MAG: hypothetical protein U5K79_02505 [Cyclobacteriaceae bacterium]|nr:hypothetical protein [Cyclobacteriaceae bacterium]